MRDFRPLAAEWLARGRVHAGLILLPSTRTRARDAIAAVAGAIENVPRNHPDGLSGSERWIGPLPNFVKGLGAVRGALGPVQTSLAGLGGVGYARLSSSTGMVRTPAVWRAYSAKPG
jgi:hypothetical protein